MTIGNTADNPPILMVYKEIVAGDLRKLQAMSNNDAKAGGGARDLRLPWKAFRHVMHQIFDKEDVARGGKPVRAADITYLDENNDPKTTRLLYWHNTQSRPTEDRIAQVHANPAIGGQIPTEDKGRVFLLLIKFADGMVRSVYAYEDELKAGYWSDDVASQILGCMRSSDFGRGRKTAQGYYDFTKGTGYCHAD